MKEGGTEGRKAGIVAVYNMDPRSARPGLGSQLAEVFDGLPDISDIRGECL